MAIDIGWDATTLTYSKAINELLEKNEGIEKDALPLFEDTDAGFLDFAMDAGVHFDTEKLMAAYAMTELDFPTFLAGPRQSGNTTFAYQMILYCMRNFNTQGRFRTYSSTILVIVPGRLQNFLDGFCEYCEAYKEKNAKNNNLKDDFKITRHFVRLGNSQVVFVPFVPVSQKIEDEMINHASYGISPNAEKRSGADNYAAVYKTSESIADIEEKFINRVRGYDIRMIVLMDYLFWGPGDIIQYDCLMNRWSGCQNAKYVFGASSYDDLNTLSNSKFLEYQLARPVIGSNAHFYNVFNPKTRYQFLFDYMNFENRGVLVLPESETEFAQKMFFKSSPFVLQL